MGENIFRWKIYYFLKGNYERENVCVCVRIYVCKKDNICVCIRVWAYVCVCVSMYESVYM